MTTLTNTISNNLYWSNASSNQLFDIDDLFASAAFDINYNQDFTPDSIMIKDEEYEKSSSPQMNSQIDANFMESQITNLICGVCGAPAHGYNFDQITCESCKAFFRRNALRPRTNLKCRFSGSCVMNIHTRRQCTYCRLKKCFDINMRKVWIRTDEERELRQLQKVAKEQKKLNKSSNNQPTLLNLPLVVRKKKRLNIKPLIQQLVQPIFTQAFLGFNRNLSEEDRILFNNIIHSHQSASENALTKYILPSTLEEFLHKESDRHTSLINFYKSIPEFRGLNVDDQVLLIKNNLVRIFHLHGILVDQFTEDPMIGSHMSTWLSMEFHDKMSRTRRRFDVFKEHGLILQLSLIVFIFGTTLATTDHTNQQNEYRDKTSICAIQDYYTTVLWRYLNTLYDEKDAIRAMEIITTQVLHYQTLMNIMEEKLRRDNCLDNPLELSLFRLT